jgi:eukaryotic-like serine/threonine-protein kinase
MLTAGVNFPCNVELPKRYEAMRWIADGGMASVWCVHDHVLGRRVAIKLLADRFAHNDRAIRRFMREARTAAQLSGHPHVVSIHDIGEAVVRDAEEAARPFIVMDYLAGGTVAGALRHQQIDRELALRWLGEAASALDYAHTRGVVHRDIKPGNLLLDRDRLLYVGDFGIARLGSEETITQADQVLGTAAYISPEQALGGAGGRVSEASDRYSLAVVAYELLAGERPFTAQHVMAQARQHIEEDPPRASRRNPALPGAVDAVLARGMAKRPEDRFETAAAFVAALERAAALRPQTVIVSPNRRRRAVLASLAAAAFVVGVVAGAASDPGTPRARASAHVTSPVHHSAVRPRPAPAKRKHHAQSTMPAPSTTAAPSAETLLARANQLIGAGNPAAAVPILRQAMAAAGPGTPTYLAAVRELMLALREAAQQPQAGGVSPAGPPGHLKRPKGPGGAGPPGHDH